MMETVIYAVHWGTIVLMVVGAVLGLVQAFGFLD